MKRSISILMSVILVLTLLAVPVNAMSMSNNHEGANYKVLVNAITAQKQSVDEAMSPRPSEETKNVSVTLAVPYGAHFNRTYFYEDDFYSGTLRIAHVSTVSYPDGTKDNLVTYAGVVSLKK